MITDDRIFVGCVALNQVDVVEEAELHETIAALHLDTWRVVLNREIDSINLILPNARAGNDFDDGEKSETIQEWIWSLCHLLDYYKVEHQRILDDAADTLEVAIPRDIVIKNVLSFLILPS